MKLQADVRLIFGDDIFDTVLVKKGTPIKTITRFGKRTIRIELETPINGYTSGRIVMHCHTPLNVEPYMNSLINPG
jgi:hypothetical protein